MSTSAADTAAPAAAGAAPGPLERLAGHVQRSGALVVLVAVCLVASLTFDSFATVDNARNIAIASSTLAIIAIGMTFVILSGGIDLSVGSVFALGGVLAAWASRYGPVPALVLPLVVCGGFGLVNGVLVARVRMAPFIVTLASLLGARGLLLAITDEGATTYDVPSGTWFAEMGQGSVLGIGLPVLVALVLFGAGVVLLQHTRFGRSVFAVGGSESASALMGLPITRIKVSVYLMSGLLAGFAGALNAARLSSGVTILGQGLELAVIAAVVIGGTLLAGGAGSLGGTLAGVLLLGVIQNVINQVGSLSPAFQNVVNGAFLAVVVVVQTVLSRTQRL